MDIAKGIGFLIFAGMCLWSTFAIDYRQSLLNKILVLASALLLVMDILGALSAFGLFNKPKQHFYPATEYRLSIETTTLGNRTDTTYVITGVRDYPR